MDDTNVTVFMPFRDNADDVIRLFNVFSTINWPPKQLRIVAVEGDSTDDTYCLLKFWEGRFSRFDKVEVIKKDLGLPKFPSVIDSCRLAALSEIFNCGLEASLADDWANFVLVIPSDVEFEIDIIENLVSYDKPHIAPMFWATIGGKVSFYDTWGFKPVGSGNWSNFPKATWDSGQEPFQMEFAGGPALIRRDVLDAGCRYTPQEADNGLCKMIHSAGFSVWVAPAVNVYHIETR